MQLRTTEPLILLLVVLNEKNATSLSICPHILYCMEYTYLDTLAATLWFFELGGCHRLNNKIMREILIKVKRVHADELGIGESWLIDHNGEGQASSC